jgi:hypothetical protein
MAAKPSSATVSKELANRLRFSGLSKDAVKELAAVAADVHAAAGLRDARVFPIGIPTPDGVGLKGNIALDRIDVIKAILRDQGRIGGVRVFPNGIPAPDVLRVTFEIR